MLLLEFKGGVTQPWAVDPFSAAVSILDSGGVPTRMRDMEEAYFAEPHASSGVEGGEGGREVPHSRWAPRMGDSRLPPGSGFTPLGFRSLRPVCPDDPPLWGNHWVQCTGNPAGLPPSAGCALLFRETAGGGSGKWLMSAASPRGPPGCRECH